MFEKRGKQTNNNNYDLSTGWKKYSSIFGSLPDYTWYGGIWINVIFFDQNKRSLGALSRRKRPRKALRTTTTLFSTRRPPRTVVIYHWLLVQLRCYRLKIVWPTQASALRNNLFSIMAFARKLKGFFLWVCARIYIFWYISDDLSTTNRGFGCCCCCQFESILIKAESHPAERATWTLPCNREWPSFRLGGPGWVRCQRSVTSVASVCCAVHIMRHLLRVNDCDQRKRARATTLWPPPAHSRSSIGPRWWWAHTHAHRHTCELKLDYQGFGIHLWRTRRG